MPFIIDGHNLIPKIPGLSLRMLDDEEELIKLLINFNQKARKKIMVFFDNAPAGEAGERRYGYLTAIFIKEGRSADSAIRIQLDRLGKSAKNWTVVSSDQEVQMSARSLGARVTSSEDFARSIVKIINKDDAPDELAESYPDEGEVQQWLDIFDRKPGEDKN